MVAVCFSLVATETSTLTIIGLPAVAYGGSLTFMQLTLGYLAGRVIVSVYLLPRYYDRQLVTTYEFLGIRYGDAMRAAASATFLVTRLLADGVRLVASAIPIKVIAISAGVQLGYFEIIFVLVTVTVFYTYLGGIRAVVWIDAAVHSADRGHRRCGIFAGVAWHGSAHGAAPARVPVPAR